jgi:gamma-glutamyltranspeptidase
MSNSRRANRLASLYAPLPNLRGVLLPDLGLAMGASAAISVCFGSPPPPASAGKSSFRNPKPFLYLDALAVQSSMSSSSGSGSYPAGNAAFGAFPSRRSVVHGVKGIVSTVSPLANDAGLRILRVGGNAADAAVAAATVLGLVDPSMSGIGGDAFALFYDHKSKQVHSLNGSGRSAANATVDDICRDLQIDDRTYGVIPTTSAHAVTVPGGAAAWADIVERFGSGRVTLAQVLAPAIEMAEGGCPISEIASYHVSTGCTRAENSS